jgi:ribosomal-protein-alanine N-acetyltransferase
MTSQDLSFFPTFITDRLILRKLNDEDAENLAVIRSNDVVNKFLNRPGKITSEDARGFIQKTNNRIQNNELLYWAITLKGNDMLIGTTCLFNFSEGKIMAELGYELHPDFHGKGIMNEAISTVINYGFKEMNLKTLVALTKPGNLNSVKLLKRNNFTLDMYFDIVRREDASDFAVYFMTLPDFSSKKHIF